jgi:hypothetical protein
MTDPKYVVARLQSCKDGTKATQYMSGGTNMWPVWSLAKSHADRFDRMTADGLAYIHSCRVEHAQETSR